MTAQAGLRSRYQQAGLLLLAVMGHILLGLGLPTEHDSAARQSAPTVSMSLARSLSASTARASWRASTCRAPVDTGSKYIFTPCASRISLLAPACRLSLGLRLASGWRVPALKSLHCMYAWGLCLHATMDCACHAAECGCTGHSAYVGMQQRGKWLLTILA